jgi:hypothetical protein
MTLGEARDISLIILICPALICALIPAAIVFGSWYAMRRTTRALPPQFQKARGAMRRTRDGVDAATRVITRPIFYAETQSARVRSVWRSLRGLRREK